MWICHCNVGKTNRLKQNGNENIWCHQNMNRKKCVYFDNDKDMHCSLDSSKWVPLPWKEIKYENTNIVIVGMNSQSLAPLSIENKKNCGSFDFFCLPFHPTSRTTPYSAYKCFIFFSDFSKCISLPWKQKLLYFPYQNLKG